MAYPNQCQRVTILLRCYKLSLANLYHTYLPSDPLFKAWSRYGPLLMIGHSKTSKMPYAMKPYLHTLTNQSLYS